MVPITGKETTMQKQTNIPGFTEITQTAPIAGDTHGGRAKCLQRLIRLEMPVPKTLALSFDTVHGVAAGNQIGRASCRERV